MVDNEKKALAALFSLIEQANAQGLFKKLNQLDMARGALQVVTQSVEELETYRKNKKNDGTDAGTGGTAQ